MRLGSVSNIKPSVIFSRVELGTLGGRNVLSTISKSVTFLFRIVQAPISVVLGRLMSSIITAFLSCATECIFNSWQCRQLSPVMGLHMVEIAGFL